MAAYRGVTFCGKSVISSAVFKSRNRLTSTDICLVRAPNTPPCLRLQGTMTGTRRLLKNDVFRNDPIRASMSTCCIPSRSIAAEFVQSKLTSNSQCHLNIAFSCIQKHSKSNSLRWCTRMMSSVADSVPSKCWNCSVDTDRNAAEFFCDKCSAIQPVIDDLKLNHFKRMQCDERYDLDVAQLTQTCRSLQRQLHPDKYSNKSQREQAYSADQSSAVNKAYSTLRKPLSRGLYLLGLHGHSIEESDSTVEPEFLMEVMDTNEQLAETQDMGVVRQMRAENNKNLQELMKELTVAFAQGQYQEARNILVHLKYYANIEDKAKDILGTDALE